MDTSLDKTYDTTSELKFYVGIILNALVTGIPKGEVWLNQTDY